MSKQHLFNLSRYGILPLAAAGVLVAATTLLAGAGPRPRPTAALVSDPPEPKDEEKRGPEAPDTFMFRQRASGGTPPKLAQLTHAAHQAARIARAADPGVSAPSGNWEFVGPTSIGGRITDLVVDPLTADTVYAAAANGGIWKSSDAGSTFTSIWPNDLPQSIGALAIAKDGTLWVGTGEANGSVYSYEGAGLYSSKDGGRSWAARGPSDLRITGRIIIDPINSRRIFVAALGYLWGTAGDRGVYRSDDGGSTFKRVLDPENATTGAVDLAIDPKDPQRIFATMWDRRGSAEERVRGGLGSGLFRSLDGGDHWTRLANITTPAPKDYVKLARHADLGRISVSIAPSDSNRVYVYAIGRLDGAGLGFYVSTDRGDSFQASTDPENQSSYGWWFGRTFVDPVDADHLFVVGVLLGQSSDGGKTWGNPGSFHADQHAMAWDSKRPGRIYLGTDGGVYRSEMNGASRSWVAATVQPFTQFYGVDVAEDNVTHVTGGTQDNGSLRSWSTAGRPAWQAFVGGDGLATLVDPSDSMLLYGCYQNGNCFRMHDSQPALDRYITAGTTSLRRGWYTPLVFDPSDSHVLYYGGNVLNRSPDRGDTWTAISPSAPNDLPGPPSLPGGDPNYGTITTVAVARTHANTIYVGTDTGRVWKTEDRGVTWVRFTGKGLPTRWVTRVAVDPNAANIAYATFSGYFAGEKAAHVFTTSDGGTSWQDISANLPNAPVNDLIVDSPGRTIYVATDLGVYALNRSSRMWQQVGMGLPMLQTMGLRLHQPSRTLLAATHGRSIWKIALP